MDFIFFGIGGDFGPLFNAWKVRRLLLLLFYFLGGEEFQQSGVNLRIGEYHDEGILNRYLSELEDPKSIGDIPKFDESSLIGVLALFVFDVAPNKRPEGLESLEDVIL